MWRCSREEKNYFSGRAPMAPVHVVMLISLQHQAYWKCLLYKQPFVFNAALENIAVLYGLSTSSGSHHFVATRDLCPGRSSTSYRLVYHVDLTFETMLLLLQYAFKICNSSKHNSVSKFTYLILFVTALYSWAGYQHDNMKFNTAHKASIPAKSYQVTHPSCWQ